jgi:hypothetical protein
MDGPVVFIHGFEQKGLFAVIDAAKKAAQEAGIDPSSIAFASSTPVNMEWKVKNLIRAVRREHAQLSGNKE